jgi:hypothetical protein
MEVALNAGTDEILEVRASGRLCGSYHYQDRFISFFRGLYTPKGLDVVAPPPKDPKDHPHHKGLQYGLCAHDVDFWEETTQSAHGRRVGRQVTQKLDPFDIGFSQEVVWCDGACEIFRETRKISVQLTPPGFVWSWQTTLTAMRDVTLDVSAWPVDGFGYVGLGLRLAPELFLKESTVTLVPAQRPVLGSTPQRVTVRGTKATLTFEQDPSQQNALYIQGCEPSSRDDFAFVSLGPTNAHGFTVNKGNSLKGSYRVTVADVD